MITKVIQSESERLDDKKDTWEVDYSHIGVKLECALNTDEDKIRDNIRINMQRPHPQIWPHKTQDTEICICAGGPSLPDYIEDIKERQVNGAKVIALANTAHLLAHHGIRYNAHMLLDAKPRNATFIMPGIETTYFIASQCDPEVFERAEETGNDIFLYHAVNNAEEFEILHNSEDPWIPVQGGSTLTFRALRLFNILGYQNFHVFGFDSCYGEGDTHHAYEQPDADKHKKLKLEFEGREFQISPWMLAQFLEFTTFVKNFGMNLNMQVHGNGLMSYLIERGSGQIKLEEQ